MRGIIGYYSNNFEYDNEVVYLKSDIFNRNQSWFIKAALDKARYILALSLKFSTEESEREENDKRLAWITKDVSLFAPQAQITIVF
jgi:hypothetical protein